VNGNDAKWKQLVDRAEANRHTLHKFLDGRTLFTGLFHMYVAAYREQHGIETGSFFPSRTNQTLKKR
jgi:hypothetical protein